MSTIPDETTTANLEDKSISQYPLSPDAVSSKIIYWEPDICPADSSNKTIENNLTGWALLEFTPKNKNTLFHKPSLQLYANKDTHQLPDGSLVDAALFVYDNGQWNLLAYQTDGGSENQLYNQLLIGASNFND